MEQQVTLNNAPNPARGEASVSVQPGRQFGPSDSQEAASGRPEAGVAEQYIQPQGGGGQAAAPPAQPPQVQPVAQTSTQSAVAPPDDNPLIADDVDVIEKEWVDKAKQIVAATHDDPRDQERKVSELQSDYLKKRYGKEIGVSEK